MITQIQSKAPKHCYPSRDPGHVINPALQRGDWSLDILRTNSRGLTLTRPAATLSPRARERSTHERADLKDNKQTLHDTVVTAWHETSI